MIVVVRASRYGGSYQRAYPRSAPQGRALDRAVDPDVLASQLILHENILLREWKGREFVGTVRIAMLISSLSGLYLWWPAKAFGFRRGLPLHRNFTARSESRGAVVLAMLSFTASSLGFPDAGRTVIAIVRTCRHRRVEFSPLQARENPIGPHDAVTLVRECNANSAVLDVHSGMSGWRKPP